jgi:FkbM family methyltransferase
MSQLCHIAQCATVVPEVGTTEDCDSAPWLGFDQLKAPTQIGGGRALFQYHKVAARGVVHVGASEGQELETYLALGFEKILCIEPHPGSFRRLEQHFEFWRRWLKVMHDNYGATEVPRLDAVMCAASDRAGTGTLHIAADPGESSLLVPLPSHIRLSSEVCVKTQRLDDVIADQGLKPDDFSLLVMDIQGAELLALQGAPRLLDVLDMAVVEVNYRPRYVGSATEPQVEDFFAKRRYRAVVRRHAAPWAPAGDVAYVRDRSGACDRGRP